MRALRVPQAEQYRLVMECRKSGLSDQQWCLNHDIKPGTFYNWVKRLKQKGCQDIPVATGRTDLHSEPQEVVQNERNKPMFSQTLTMDTLPVSGGMEFSVGNIRLRIPNGTDPMLLAQTLKVLTELSC